MRRRAHSATFSQHGSMKSSPRTCLDRSMLALVSEFQRMRLRMGPPSQPLPPRRTNSSTGWHGILLVAMRVSNADRTVSSCSPSDFYFSNFSLNRRIQTALSNSIKAVNFSSAPTTKRSPSSRCASAIQIVRPSESTAETQPQLQPALLRKADRRTVQLWDKKPQRPTSCARDTAQGKICLKNANER
jgi:hypothetical protein